VEIKSVATAGAANVNEKQGLSRVHNQGCQIFLGSTYKKGEKMYQLAIKYTKLSQNILDIRKMGLMVIKYTNIFHYKTLQNLPKLGFLV
jgi:hypothetical protein